jgi:hypothetical protein
MLAAGGIDIADAFSTDLYTGNGGTQTITNGIDLSGEGGLVWIKDRNSGAKGHALFDTERGVNIKLQSQSTTNGAFIANQLTAFNANGFDIGTSGDINGSGTTFASWTFRKAPKFFDVVTYTGDGGSNRTIPHSLGIVPGMVIVKRTDGGAENWSVDHRNLVQGSPLFLNLTQASVSTGGTEFPTEPTDENFYVGTNNTQNGNTFEYVAYIFAHDTEDDSVIQCGSYTGNGSTSGPVITLGWEPQWLMIKRSNAAANWHIFDAARGLTTSTDKSLRPNLSSAEMGVQGTYQATATGFTVNQAYNDFNASGSTYIYMAIRKESA